MKIYFYICFVIVSQAHLFCVRFLSGVTFFQKSFIQLFFYILMKQLVVKLLKKLEHLNILNSSKTLSQSAVLLCMG